jgi:Cytochrome P450
MIRWVTQVKEFMHTATADTSVGGVPVAAGESLLLSYPSANRNEKAFDDPFRFDVGRDPNKHLAFGFGVHLLPRRGAGPDGDARPVRGAVAAAGIRRAHGPAGVGGHDLRRRPQAPPIRYALKG